VHPRKTDTFGVILFTVVGRHDSSDPCLRFETANWYSISSRRRRSRAMAKTA